ncbi:hypothetical protein PAMC26577_17955 [Caballeronia sordidicola]|uniref:Uncharacterized protein n=1 Tax=Caballeronia sordidicola TaxID=196367 RepID=A0A242MQF5_CABSO|nr:hypothetical protein PAMC26577_17955 [Caballeronia sordidicola]
MNVEFQQGSNRALAEQMKRADEDSREQERSFGENEAE